MIKKRWHAVLFAAVVVMAVLAAMAWEHPSQTAMDSITEKSVKLPIIMYHSVLSNPKKADTYVVTPENLRSDLKYLKNNGFETVVVQDLIDYVHGSGTLPEKPVMITFDDGHYNTLYYALPILDEMDMRAVLSVVGLYADIFTQHPDPNPNYAYLSWDEVQLLIDSGRFEIQNHSYAMHSIGDRKGSQRKNGESVAAYSASFCTDVMRQQLLLQEKCGITATAFTYPFGLVSAEAQEYLEQMHFQASLTCYERINYIQKGNLQCLFNLGRYNRPGKASTNAFMNRLLKQMK